MEVGLGSKPDCHLPHICLVGDAGCNFSVTPKAPFLAQNVTFYLVSLFSPLVLTRTLTKSKFKAVRGALTS